MSELKDLVNKSIYILREVKAEFKNPAILFSTGKDSLTGLSLCREAFFGTIPFPVIHIDTTFKFPVMYDFRDNLAKEWGFNLIVAKNQKAIDKGMSVTQGHLKCCTELKTKALKMCIDQYGFDAIIVCIRRDEHGIRSKERVFSSRDNFKWNYNHQPAEMWEQYHAISGEGLHTRIHPILHWREINCWEYLKSRGLPINPMYFSINGHRYRSLGCQPCTQPISSSASNIDEVIEELRITKDAERAGRAQDKESKSGMQALRSLGYM